MKRMSLILTGAITCILLAAVGTATAMPTEGSVNSKCNTRSRNVTGNKVAITVTGQSVASSKAEYAACQHDDGRGQVALPTG